MKVKARAEFWVVVQMIWFEGTKKVSSDPDHLPWTHAHWLNSSHKELSFHFKPLLSRLIMSIWKDWKNKSFGNSTTSRCYHLPTQVHELLIRWLFSMMLVETGARKEWEFMEKVVWNSWAVFWKPGRSAPKRKQQQMTQNLGLGATRGERIKIKEVRRYAENPPKDVCF